MPEQPRIGAVPFAIIVCVICSLVLATVSSSLKDLQMANKKADMQYNVLKALKIEDLEIMNEKGKRIISNEDMAAFFKDNITGKVLDADGKIVDGLSPDNLKSNDIKKKKTNPLYIYTYKDAEGKEHTKYAIHVSGMGLWSTIRGFLALEEDKATISGISFYEHGETPGLGAEITTDRFQDQYKGKKIADDGGNFATVTVLKGVGNDVSGNYHDVDGISGATMTTNGVTDMFTDELQNYTSYFNKIKS